MASLLWTDPKLGLVVNVELRPGSVVRVAPNEVSFNSYQSWTDIYGFRPGHRVFIKSDFYEGGSFSARGVHSMAVERSVDAHAQMRRHLSHAFSSQSLAEQEALIAESVDKFINGGVRHHRGPGLWRDIRRIGQRQGSSLDFNLSRGVKEVSTDRRVQAIPTFRQPGYDSHAWYDQQAN